MEFGSKNGGTFFWIPVQNACSKVDEDQLSKKLSYHRETMHAYLTKSLKVIRSDTRG